jgi:hypothetical protein
MNTSQNDMKLTDDLERRLMQREFDAMTFDDGARGDRLVWIAGIFATLFFAALFLAALIG